MKEKNIKNRPDIISICLISDMKNMSTVYMETEKRRGTAQPTWEKLSKAKVFNPVSRNCQLVNCQLVRKI